MNGFVSSWNMDDDYRLFHDALPQANQRKSVRSDNELIELVWQNGHVVMHSQTNDRDTNVATNEHKEIKKQEVPTKCGGALDNMNNLIQEDETATWLHYTLDDAFGKDFCSDILYGMPTIENLAKNPLIGEAVPKQINRLQIEENPMPPPNERTTNDSSLQNNCAKPSEIVNFSHFSRHKFDKGFVNQHHVEKVLTNGVHRGAGESSSMLTKLSGNWRSNQIQINCDSSRSLSNADTDIRSKHLEDGQKKHNEREPTETHDATTVTSSSGGSGSSVGKTGQMVTGNQSHKRKGRDTEEFESQSEDVECQSVDEDRQTRRSASVRRTRAAEVHNLSERRRRDRINEKMKALQELIPHCNKTDKASMLDEAIEYLKSLQLQVQLMWMGGAMAPMMFPNPQQYLSLISRGMSHGALPSIPGVMQMPRVPMVNQSASSGTASTPALRPSSILNPVNFTNPMQNANMPDAYAHYLGYHQMQLQSQAVNLFNPYGSQVPQSGQNMAALGRTDLPTDGTILSENGKSG